MRKGVQEPLEPRFRREFDWNNALLFAVAIKQERVVMELKAAKSKVAKAKREQGMALLLTVFLIAFVGVIASALILGANLNLRVTHNLAENKRAFYGAEAGLNYARYLLEEAQGVPEGITEDNEFAVDERVNFNLEFQEDVPEEGKITVISTGYCGNSNARVMAVFARAHVGFFNGNQFIVSSSNIKLKGNANISGNNAGNVLTNGYLDLGGGVTYSNVQFGASGGTEDIPEEFVIENFPGVDLPLIDWDTVYLNSQTVSITHEGKGNGKNGENMIALGEDPKLTYLYPDSIKEQGLTIEGRGTLFIDGSLDISGGDSKISDGAVLIVRDDVKITGNQLEPYRFSLFAGGDIDIAANLDLYGRVIGRGEVKISGKKQILFDASMLDDVDLGEYAISVSKYELVDWEELD